MIVNGQYNFVLLYPGKNHNLSENEHIKGK